MPVQTSNNARVSTWCCSSQLSVMLHLAVGNVTLLSTVHHSSGRSCQIVNHSVSCKILCICTTVVAESKLAEKLELMFFQGL